MKAALWLVSIALGSHVLAASGVEHCDPKNLANLQAGTFDTSSVAMFGSPGSGRYAYRINSADAFVMACPIEASNSRFDGTTCGKDEVALIADGDLLLVDKHSNNEIHLHTWRLGKEIDDVVLNTQVSTGSYIEALSGKFGTQTVFVYISPSPEMKGIKTYSVEVFYSAKCEADQPANSHTVVKATTMKASLGQRKRVHTDRGKGKSTKGKDAGQGQGNTTGGGEPSHHP